MRQPRTLAEAIRSLTPGELTALLEGRPDLSWPAPDDLVDLVNRATSGTSVRAALDTLDAFRRLVAEGLAALSAPASVPEVSTLLAAPAVAVRSAVGDLRALALLWGPDDAVHLVRAVRETFHPYPGGLAPPSARPLAEAEVAAALAECDPAAATLVARLAWSPAGALRQADRTVSAATARSPVEQLLARRLLHPLDASTVLLPREVALVVREHRFTPEPVPPDPPPLGGHPRPLATVDRAAAGSAYELLHDVELLIHALTSSPHRLLRSGGLSARDLGALARGLSSNEHTAFLVELAAATGLIAAGDGLRLLPTKRYDAWLQAQPVQRWRELVERWLVSPRLLLRTAQPGLHPLDIDPAQPAALRTAGAAGVRRALLDLAVAAGAGVVLTQADLAAALRWHRPRVAATLGVSGETVVAWTWREAGWLGLLGLGAVSGFAAPLIAGTELPSHLAGLLPATVDRLVLQADLTAVATGPLTAELAADIRLLADQESRGGAGVFRFSAASLRRALDAGWTESEVSAWLTDHATTDVPQPLAYLVADVARRFGAVRVGVARSWVRIDDPAAVAAVLAHPEAALLELREIAPGVLVSPATEAEVVALLIDLDQHPAVEDSAGRTRVAPAGRRAPTPALPAAPSGARELARRLVEGTAGPPPASRLARCGQPRSDDFSSSVSAPSR